MANQIATSPKTPSGRAKSRKQKTPVPVSPVTCHSSLTLKRRVSDLCVNLHSYVQQWETLNQASFHTVNTLVNLVGQVESGSALDKLPGLEEECCRKYILKLLHTQEELMKSFKQQFESFRDLVMKFNACLENFKAVYYLALCSSAGEDAQSFADVSHPIFQTWTAEMFYDTAFRIVNFFVKEYLLKEKLRDHIMLYVLRGRSDSSDNSDNSSLCASMWLQQPFIDQHVDLLVDGMLYEAELKSS